MTRTGVGSRPASGLCPLPERTRLRVLERTSDTSRS